MNKKLIVPIIILTLLMIAEIIFIGFGSGQPRATDDVRREEDVTGANSPDTAESGTAGTEESIAGAESPDTAVMGTAGSEKNVTETSGDNKSGENINVAGTNSDGVADTDKGRFDKAGSDIVSYNERPVGDSISLINEDGTTAAERISPPEGFERLPLGEGSFGEYLRNLPLKPHGSRVKYFDGATKPWDVHVAVVDIDVGKRDLQQCADAVIRLRAEYLYKNGKYDQIHFNFTNGFNAEYSKWIQGHRISISGNKAVWVENGSKGTGYESFRKYLDIVFAYAGTLSLSKEMKKIDPDYMQPGDVFLKGGSPGHCVIIIDMAENPQTGERVFLAAQSYMPAQDIHILRNPANGDGNPWYPVRFGDELVTPEWTFPKDLVYRFAE